MKKSGIIVCFAFLAAILTLTTTCIAGPIQQSISMDAVESEQQESVSSIEVMASELANSIKALGLKMKNDRYLNNSLQQLLNDKELSAIVNSIKIAKDLDTKITLIESYVNVLQKKQVFISLKAYFQRIYSVSIQNINVKCNQILDITKNNLNSITPPSADLIKAQLSGSLQNMNNDQINIMIFEFPLLLLALYLTPGAFIIGLITWQLATILIMLVGVPILIIYNLSGGYIPWPPDPFYPIELIVAALGFGAILSTIWPVLCALAPLVLWYALFLS